MIDALSRSRSYGAPGWILGILTIFCWGSAHVVAQTRLAPHETLEAWLAEMRACEGEQQRLVMLEGRGLRAEASLDSYRSLLDDELAEVRAFACRRAGDLIRQTPVDERDEQAIDAVVGALSDPAPIVRVYAAESAPVLVAHDVDRFADVRARALDVLVAEVRHESPVVRRMAAYRLSGFGGLLGAGDVEKLEQAMKSDDAEVRRGVASAMRRLAHSSSRARELMEAARGDDDALVRVTAAGAWLETGGEFGDVRELLVGAFDDPDAVVRSRALYWIGFYGRDDSEAMTELLLRRLDDESRAVRLACCGHLGNLEADAAVCQSQLLERLASPDRIVREACAFALGAIRGGDPIAIVPRLVDVAQDDPDDSTRNWAASSIERYAAREAGELAERLESMLSSDDESSRLDAVKVIAHVDAGSPSTVPLAIRALGDTAPVVRMWAAYALGKAGESAAPGIPALIKSLDDGDPSVVTYACWALGACGVLGEPALEALARCAESGNAETRESAERAVTAIRAALDDAAGDSSDPPARR